MEFFENLEETGPRDEYTIEQICSSFDMDCVGLDHDACWRGLRGCMPCCGMEVEFEKVKGICPFLWVKEH